MDKNEMRSNLWPIALACQGLALASVLLVAASCRGPSLPERIASGHARDLARSPAVISAVIYDLQKASWIHASKIDGYPVQLFRMNVAVENVLKGDIPERKLDIYFYRKMGSEGGLARISFRQYQRYIFYLQKESGIWRTSCDYYEHCADLVLTGGHPHFKRNPARPIGDDILDLLFTREDGQGVSDGTMVDAISSRMNYGRRWIYERMDDFVKLLEKTVQTESPAVRTEACEQLRTYGKPCKPCEAENVLHGRFPQ